MLLRSGLTALALLCALSNGAHADSPVIAAVRADTSVGAGGEARGPAIDALAFFLHGLAATASYHQVEPRRCRLRFPNSSSRLSVEEDRRPSRIRP